MSHKKKGLGSIPGPGNYVIIFTGLVKTGHIVHCKGAVPGQQKGIQESTPAKSRMSADIKNGQTVGKGTGI